MADIFGKAPKKKGLRLKVSKAKVGEPCIKFYNEKPKARPANPSGKHIGDK
jgi:hypothetical protein